ncbi:uncharacterized protein METZ01_LOCUS93031 [marine metagenome]|uniref:Uncharacterized protein n=1 Tax=marine metagenome TaxID=408172 RepID=A0A381VKI6_9ZZZZ
MIPGEEKLSVILSITNPIKNGRKKVTIPN